jgi:uncharacterized protein (DUF1800 family)
MTRRMILAFAAAAVAANSASPGGQTGGRFDIKLSSEQKIRQALNRLTFGARPGDVEEIRRLGVEKWIEMQLHPERIAENALLAQRLKPLESIRLDNAAIFKQYYPQFPPGMVRPVNMNELLPGELMRKVYNGTAEQRRATLLALSPEVRAKVLSIAPATVVEDLPDLQKEQAEARKKVQEERQAEMRRLRPPLSDLLTPDQVRIATRGTPEQREALFDSLDPEKLERVAASLPPGSLAGRPDLRRAAEMSRFPQNVVLSDLREAKLYRAVYSNRQLEEVLTDFWFNHFNVYEAKGQSRGLLAAYERDTIRPHVLGKFKDLLLATAHDPAMLTYLDNWESMAPDAFDIGPFAPGPFGGGQRFFGRQAHGLNENYGRELLELHTMGVNGGYTQQDVIAVARCFTGWTVRQPGVKPEFVYAAFMHDSGEKTVLGHTIAAGGQEQDGLQVIDILARHPSTARFISTKLARRFVADDPPPALVERMARTFTKTDGDLRAVLETMFTSKEFFSEGAWLSKIKSPLEMVVSAVRALAGDVDDSVALAVKVGEMGEPLYGKEPPTGYRDVADAWLSTANVMARIEFAGALAQGRVPGVKVTAARFEGSDAASVARALLHREPTEQTMAAIDKGLAGRTLGPGVVAAAVLSSPEFQRR